MTVHSNAYTSHSTKRIHCVCLCLCVCVCGQRQEEKKEIEREGDTICPSAPLSVHLSCRCVSGAAHSTEHSITGAGLREFCARGMSVCQYMCCKVTHVEADQHAEWINTRVWGGWDGGVGGSSACPSLTVVFSQLLQVMPLALGAKLLWAQALNFSEAHAC